VRTSVIAPYTAYLRVYEPLAAFAEPERTRWEKYVASGEAPDPVAGGVAERRGTLANLVPTPPVAIPPRESEEAFVRTGPDGVALVCPWQTRLRSFLALEEFRAGLPPALVDAFLPRIVADQAEADFARFRTENPDANQHILTATWHVPLRWFVLFGEDERELSLGGGARRSLCYQTPMVQARRRVARGLRVLRRTVESAPMVEELEELGRWLEEFHPRSHVELDYGGLVHLVADDELKGDRSAAEVADGLAALSAGDRYLATQAYQRLTDRWRSVQALEHAN
jgi:hypothetical protein